MITPSQSYLQASVKGKIYHAIGLVLLYIAFNFFVLDSFNGAISYRNNSELYLAILVGLAIPTVALVFVEMGIRVLNFVFGITITILRSIGVSLMGKASEISKTRSDKEWVERNVNILSLERHKAKDPFSGTIDRGEFIGKFIFGSLALSIYLTFLDQFEYLDWFDGAMMILMLALFIAAARHLLLLPIVKRTRSTGLNPWISLVLLVPGVNLPFLVFLIAAPEGAARKVRIE